MNNFNIEYCRMTVRFSRCRKHTAWRLSILIRWAVVVVRHWFVGRLRHRPRWSPWCSKVYTRRLHSQTRYWFSIVDGCCYFRCFFWVLDSVACQASLSHRCSQKEKSAVSSHTSDILRKFFHSAFKSHAEWYGVCVWRGNRRCQTIVRINWGFTLD